MAKTPLTGLRDEMWLEHIEAHADADGVWENTAANRLLLPTASTLSDVRRHRLLQQLARRGLLERVGFARYRVAEGASRLVDV